MRYIIFTTVIFFVFNIFLYDLHPQNVDLVKLKEKEEAHLIALACSEPPAGQARWTLELLTKQLLEDGVIARISPETVRLLLKKTVSNPGRYEAGAFQK